MSARALVLSGLATYILLTGCAVNPRVDLSVEQMTTRPSSTAMATTPEALRNNVAFEGGNGSFYSALKASLREAGLLEQAGRFMLSAVLVKFEEPTFGFNMTVTPTVRYVLYDLYEQSSRKRILDKTITTPFTADFGEAFLGVERKKLAAEGAIRANINEFLAELTRLNPTMLAEVLTPPAPASASSPAPEPTRAITVNEQPEPLAKVSEAPPQPKTVASSESAARTTTTPQSTPSAQTTTDALDVRAAEMKKVYASLLQQARSGKMRYLNAARQYKEKFEKMYPEELNNALMSEYLAYMAVVGERVDRRKLTEAEAEYELAKKVSELQERGAAAQANTLAQQEAVTRRAKEEADARKAIEQAAAQKTTEDASARRASEEAAARLALEEQRLALQREIAERQLAAAEARRRQESSAAMMELGLQLLSPPRSRMQTCTGQWVGRTYVQNCY